MSDDTTSRGTKNGERSPVARAKISNDKGWLTGIDGRSATARRYRDLVEQFVSDLGGFDVVSEAQVQLVRRASGLAVRLEQVEADLINGGDICSEDYVRECNTICRVLRVLGLKRQQRDVTPSLREYVDAKARTVNVDPREGSVV